IGICPHLPPVTSMNEFSGYTYLVARLTNAALQNELHIQIPRNLLKINAGTLIRGSRAMAYDSKIRGSGEFRGYFGRHPLRKAVLRRIAAEIVERKNGYRWPL